MSAVAWACRATESLHRAGRIAERFAEGFSNTGLGPARMSAVTVRLYDRLPTERPTLFAWEQAWFADDLPEPPGRILVGGCGTGREVRWLLERGYEVWAFDPSLEAMRVCERDNPSLSFAGWFSYEDLGHSFSGARQSHSRLLPEGVRFDAVLLGWASLTHVVDEGAHRALFDALGQVSPAGPILASFYFAPELPGRVRSRAFDLGTEVGRALSGHTQRADPAVRLLSHTGFVYFFDATHLQSLAAASGRSVDLRPAKPLAYATFRPR